MSLRIGVTWEKGDASAWRARCLEQLVAVPGVEFVLLIEACREKGEAGGPIASLPGRPVGVPARKAFEPGADRVSGAGRIGGAVEGAGAGRLVLTAEQLERVRRAGLDCIVHLAAAGPPAGLYGAARFGVWSFHHGDGAQYSPQSITCWEPYCRGPVLHVALVAMQGAGSLPRALQEGCLRIEANPWPRALSPILRCVADWPAKVGREALGFGENPLARARPVTMAPMQARSIASALRLAMSRFGTRLRHLLYRWRGKWREDQWAIGIVHAPIHAFLDASVARPVAWVPEHAPGEYLADPFALRTDNGVVVLCERFDHRTRRGEICAIESPDGRRFGRPRPSLALPVHLSYPFLFEHEARLYCIPEMGQSGGIQLFEFLPAAGTWHFVATLIEGVGGIDVTILSRGDRLWLFCTMRETHNSVLHIWWARTLAGPWHPHRRNPVKFDVRSARPAGTPFEHAGQLFRPSQDCSSTYGGAVRINRVTCLTTDDYAEETVAMVSPDAKGPYPAGLHTLSALGGWTLIDGKRWRWRFPWRPRGFATPDIDALSDALGRMRADTVGDPRGPSSRHPTGARP